MFSSLVPTVVLTEGASIRIVNTAVNAYSHDKTGSNILQIPPQVIKQYKAQVCIF